MVGYSLLGVNALLPFWKHSIFLRNTECFWYIIFSFDVFRPLAYVLPVMFFFVSPLVLRAPSKDRPVTLPHVRNLAEFCNSTPKIRRCSPKKIWGPKTCKISVNFGPLQTLISKISGTRKRIQNRKDVRTRKIRPAFDEKSSVNFGVLTAWSYM